MRVKKKTIRRAVLLGTFCLPIVPALAQEGGGVLYTFGLSQDFEFGDNLELDVPEAGTSAYADTNLSFGIVSERENQQLDLGMGLSVTLQDTPSTDGTDGSIDQPFIDLSYSRQAPNATLDIDASYDQQSVDRLNLSDFATSEDGLVLPEDFDNLTGAGDREAYDASISLALGTNAPLGFNLSAGVSGIDYTGSTDPGLFDYDRTNLGAEALFQVSPVLTGILGLSYSTYNASDDGETSTDTTDGYVGVEYDVSARTTVSASVGVTQIETEEFGLITTDVTNPIWNLGVVYDMPNGEITADLDLTSDDDGAERRNLLVGRSMELPDGALSYSLGVTDPEFADTALIGSLNWQRTLPSGQFSINFNRNVVSNNTDATQLATSLAVNYNHQINTTSSVGLSLFYGVTDATVDANGVEQTELSASYSHALTEDWNLNTGINYQVRDEDTVGRADSPSVFLSIGRRFDFRP